MLLLCIRFVIRIRKNARVDSERRARPAREHFASLRAGRVQVFRKKRWVVERPFAWLGGYRRLSTDFEQLPAVSEAMVQLAAIRVMVRRVA